MIYTDSFKAKMVQRLSAPNAISAIKLSKEVGVSQSALSRWLEVARTVGPMTKERPSDRVVQTGNTRPAAEKIRIVMAAAALAPDELGAFLRREGVHEVEVEQWRVAVVDAATCSRGCRDAAVIARCGHQADQGARAADSTQGQGSRRDGGAAGAPKKSPRDLGGRGRRHERGKREVILGLVNDAVAAGARRERACLQVGLAERSVQRWRRADVGDDRRAGPRTIMANALSPAERAHVLEVVNSPEYRDLPPKQVVPRLADDGRYIGSESTIYRILRAEGQDAHRGRAKPRTARSVDAHVATAANQVWSWDISAPG